MAVTVPTALLRAAMNTLGADTTTFKNATLKLYKNNVAALPSLGVGAFTECDFSGYLSHASVTWNAAVSDPVGNAILTAPSVLFSANDTVTVNTVYGAFLVGAGADSVNLVAFEPFDAPVQISGPGDFVNYGPTITLPGPGSGTVQGP